jgi:hypothetical protein
MVGVEDEYMTLWSLLRMSDRSENNEKHAMKG